MGFKALYNLASVSFLPSSPTAFSFPYPIVIIPQVLCTISSVCLEGCLPRSGSGSVISSQITCHLLMKAFSDHLIEQCPSSSPHHSLFYYLVSFPSWKWLFYICFIYFIIGLLSVCLTSLIRLRSTKVGNLVHFCFCLPNT